MFFALFDSASFAAGFELRGMRFQSRGNPFFIETCQAFSFGFWDFGFSSFASLFCDFLNL